MSNRQFPSSDLSRKSGEILHHATLSPITLTNHGKPRHVILSVEEFERLKSSGSNQRAFAMKDLPDDLHNELMTGVDAQLEEDQ